MIEFRTPQIGDLEKLRPLPEYRREAGWEMMVLRHELSDMWTVARGDQVLCIIGFRYIWPGVAQLWAIVGEDARLHGVSLTLGLRRFIENRVRERRVHRVQMTVQSEYREGRKWARSLGFEPESVLFNYGSDKKNYVMMVRQF